MRGLCERLSGWGIEFGCVRIVISLGVAFFWGFIANNVHQGAGIWLFFLAFFITMAVLGLINCTGADLE